MKFSRSEPGFLVSAAVHLGLLALLLVHFSSDMKFEDAQEAVPVETITDKQFSEIMKGDKSAKPADKPRVDKVAEVTDTKPTPPTPEAKRDIPTPPPPLKRMADPGEAEETPKETPKDPPKESAPPPPTPPQRPTPTPPAPTPPPKPKAPEPPPEDKQDEEKDDAETVKPPPRPKPPEKVDPKPVPQPPKPPEKQVEKPAPKPPEKTAPKLDEVAKLLADSKSKPTDKPADKPAAARPKSGDESAQPHRSPDLSEVAKLLNKEAPEAKFATGREVSRTAALGAARGTAAKMSPSLSDALNSLLQEQYKQCWNYLPLSGQRYVAKIRVSYNPDGSLAGQPALLNPPTDPSLRGLAESAMRAVRRCNPLRIPAQYQPYYEQWKDWVVGFDPEILN